MTIEPSAITEQLMDALATHIAVLYEHVFVSVKPQRPTQSRWTGVPCVANFCLGLQLFHNLLEPLLTSLAGRLAVSCVTNLQAE